MIERGYISPYMMTNPEKNECELENAAILVTDMKISSAKEMAEILDKAIQADMRKIFIIAEDIETEALAIFVVNKMKGVFQGAAIKAPWFGEHKKDVLKDIAILTGAEFVSEDLGAKVADITPKMFGHAKKVIVDADKTVIAGPSGQKEEIEDRKKMIIQMIAKTESGYDKERQEKRLAKFENGVGIIKIGAATEVELKEIKDRVEDALSATKAALEEGIVAGGGVIYIRLAQLLEEKFSDTGSQILISAFEQPLRQIVSNAGQSPDVVLDRVLNESGNFGYDVVKEEYMDLLEAGVIDPAKVVRVSIENALSVAVSVLMTDVVIATKKNPVAAPAMPGQPPMM